jgi:hypothetical protein
VVEDEWPATAATTPATVTPTTIAVVEIDPDVSAEPHGHHFKLPSAPLPHGHNAGVPFGTSPLLTPPAVDDATVASAANTLPETIIAKAKTNALKFFIAQSPQNYFWITGLISLMPMGDYPENSVRRKPLIPAPHHSQDIIAPFQLRFAFKLTASNAASLGQEQQIIAKAKRRFGEMKVLLRIQSRFTMPKLRDVPFSTKSRRSSWGQSHPPLVYG